MSERPQILALNSLRGKSGKDTLISLLESMGYKVARVAFGDELKRECALEIAKDPQSAIDYNAMMHKSAKDHQLEELSVLNIRKSEYRTWVSRTKCPHTLDLTKPRSLRTHLQWYATDYVREHLGKTEYWYDIGEREIIRHANSGAVDYIVVSDLRQVNEYINLYRTGFVHGMKVHTVRIHRDWFIPGVDDQPYHITDYALQAHPFDALIVNRLGEPHGMIEQLQEQGVIK